LEGSGCFEIAKRPGALDHMKVTWYIIHIEMEYVPNPLALVTRWTIEQGTCSVDSSDIFFASSEKCLPDYTGYRRRIGTL
jgi:hypothetical protein